MRKSEKFKQLFFSEITKAVEKFLSARTPSAVKRQALLVINIYDEWSGNPLKSYYRGRQICSNGKLLFENVDDILFYYQTGDFPGESQETLDYNSYLDAYENYVSEYE